MVVQQGLYIAEHAHEYGLIVRYTNGSYTIVGYTYEPRHLRYVGVELAAFLYENELTMEEFYAKVQSSFISLFKISKN